MLVLTVVIRLDQHALPHQTAHTPEDMLVHAHANNGSSLKLAVSLPFLSKRSRLLSCPLPDGATAPQVSFSLGGTVLQTSCVSFCFRQWFV